MDASNPVEIGRKTLESGANQLTPIADTSVKGIQLKAMPGNDDVIYVGTTVTSDLTAQGFPLSPGEGVFIPTNKVNNIRVKPTTVGDIVAWVVVGFTE